MEKGWEYEKDKSFHSFSFYFSKTRKMDGMKRADSENKLSCDKNWKQIEKLFLPTFEKCSEFYRVLIV